VGVGRPNNPPAPAIGPEQRARYLPPRLAGDCQLGLPDVVACDRHSINPLCQLKLPIHVPHSSECQLAPGKLELEHAAEALSVPEDDLTSVGREPLPPMPNCTGVMKTQNLDVRNKQAGALDCRQYFGQG